MHHLRDLKLPTQTSFIGFVTDNALATVFVNGPVQDNTWLTVNDLHLSVAAPVPEPATYGMLIGGLGILGFLARRTRK
nr:PEP-CTERM sorting domain-containing protein [Pseudoduganella umbonata]